MGFGIEYNNSRPSIKLSDATGGTKIYFFGGADGAFVGIGSETPDASETLKVVGDIRAVGNVSITGTIDGYYSFPIGASDGYVLTSDAFGNATWQQPSNSAAPAWFDVTAYGAVGDGITDDTNAITDTLTAAIGAHNSVVFFPPLTYATLGGHTLTSNIHLYGPGATIKKIRHDVAHLFVGADLDNIGAEGITFDLNQQAGPDPNVSSAFWIATSTNVSFLNCKFYRSIEDGLKLSDIGGLEVIGCTFDELKNNGIEIHSYVLPAFEVGNYRIIGNSFSRIDDGLLGAGNGCAIGASSAADGTYISGVVIVGNRIEDCSRGVWFENNSVGRECRNIVISNNSITGSLGGTIFGVPIDTKDGIGLIGTHGTTISNNVIYNVGELDAPGVECTAITISQSLGVTTSENVTITGNVVMDTRSGATDRTDYGIWIKAGSRAIVRDNVVYGCSESNYTFYDLPNSDPTFVLFNPNLTFSDGYGDPDISIAYHDSGNLHIGGQNPNRPLETYIESTNGVTLIADGYTLAVFDTNRIDCRVAEFRFDDNVIPIIYQQENTQQGINVNPLEIHGQNAHSSGLSSTGGNLLLKAGDGLGTNDIGGNLTAKAGHGVAGHGYLELCDGGGGQRIKVDDDGTTHVARTTLIGELRMRGPGGTKAINVESLSAQRVLSFDADSQVQIFTAALAQDVQLPADSCDGLFYHIESLGAGTLTIKRAGGATVTTLTQLYACDVICDGSTWIAYNKHQIV